MDLSSVTREAVLEAIAEHDELGEEQFLKTYGFGRARSYFLQYNGRRYASKAIVGAAHRYATGRALTADEFSGGHNTVGRLLARLGFEVVNDQSPDQRLVEQLERLRVASTADGPARHQPITLLWAFGRAVQRRPRLASWQQAQLELRVLLRQYGQPSSRPRPEFPVLALVKTDLWEMVVDTDEIPAAHGEPLGWMNEHRPHSGLATWVYELVASSEVARANAIETLGQRFFGGAVPEELLQDVGLETSSAPSTTRDQNSLEIYTRLCVRIEAAEARGDHDRSIRTSRTQPVRSRDAARAVLLPSGGHCENPLCTGEPDDVTHAGDPILEVDHIEGRADWGRDHPIQMIALCPNCHAIKTRGRTAPELSEILLAEAYSRHTAWKEQAQAGT